MAQTYIWFHTANEQEGIRCKELLDKAHGVTLCSVRYQLNEDYEQATPLLCAVPVGAGPDAGMNPGAAMIETIRSAVIAGDHPNLNSAERQELLQFIVQAEPLEDDWHAPPVEG